MSRRRKWEIGGTGVLLVVVVALMLSAGSHWRREQTDQALFAALAEGDAARVRDLLQRGADPNAIQQRGAGKGWSPLRWALFSGDLRALRCLLHYGADPNRPDSFGQTPLEQGYGDYAGETLHVAITRELLAAGATVNLAHQEGYPEHHPTGDPETCPEVARLLSEAKNREKPDPDAANPFASPRVLVAFRRDDTSGGPRTSRVALTSIETSWTKRWLPYRGVVRCPFRGEGLGR